MPVPNLTFRHRTFMRFRNVMNIPKLSAEIFPFEIWMWTFFNIGLVKESGKPLWLLWNSARVFYHWCSFSWLHNEIEMSTIFSRMIWTSRLQQKSNVLETFKVVVPYLRKKVKHYVTHLISSLRKTGKADSKSKRTNITSQSVVYRESRAPDSFIPSNQRLWRHRPV